MSKVTVNSSSRRQDQISHRQSKGKDRRNLVVEVSHKLREDIVGGDLVPGDKLPSEAALTRDFNVSRTVVREALASLRADGLVDVRHGVGVFVCEPADDPAAFEPVDRARISSMLDLLELRTAVEIEGAGLAAVRRSPLQVEAMYQRFDDLDQVAAADQPSMSADLAFHLAVADGANNPRFREFLTLMGEQLIPRSALPGSREDSVSSDYVKQIQAEHMAIVRAISERDRESARQAMRVHLTGSMDRYRHLARGEHLGDSNS